MVKTFTQLRGKRESADVVLFLPDRWLYSGPGPRPIRGRAGQERGDRTAIRICLSARVCVCVSVQTVNGSTREQRTQSPYYFLLERQVSVE